MRSNAGVGTTPPNVPGAPNPQSSVMITRTFGAPFGGTTRGGHHAFDSVAFSLITPPNFGSGGGSCLPLIVVVSLGEPGVPVVCFCAIVVDSAFLSWANVSTTRPEAASHPISPLIANTAMICVRTLFSMVSLPLNNFVTRVPPTQQPNEHCRTLVLHDWNSSVPRNYECSGVRFRPNPPENRWFAGSICRQKGRRVSEFTWR